MTRPKSPVPNVSRGAQNRVATALADEYGGDVARAMQRGSDLGPEAMVMNLGDRTTGQASTIASAPTKGSATIRQAVRGQLDRSGARAADDWERAIGPAISRYEMKVATEAKKRGTSNLYEIAKGRKVDPKGLQTAILKARQEAGNDKAARAAIDEIASMLMDPRTGKLVPHPAGGMTRQQGTARLIDDAGGLINARQAIDVKIRQIGATLSNNPADDVYQLGSNTPVGRYLVQLRKAIQNTVHQDPELVKADRIFSDASRVQNSFEMGRTKFLGRGDSVMEPEAITARLADPKISAAEKSALLQGLSRKGRQLLGDVSPNRNDGKAMGDAIATPNNLARIRAAAGGNAGNIVRQMAEREDLFAAQGNRAIGNSETALRQAGQAEFPNPVMGGKNYSIIGQRSAVGTLMEGLARLADGMTKGAVSRYRARLAEDGAKLLTASGPQRDKIVQDLMEYAQKLKTDKVNLVTPGLLAAESSTVQPRLGR